MSNFNHQGDNDEYDYVKTIKDFTVSYSALKPYSRLIKSKNVFHICVNGIFIANIRLKSFETIIKKAQAYIEEQVLWYYDDPTEPENTIDANKSNQVKEIEKPEADKDSYKIDVTSSILSSLILLYFRS